MPPARQLSQAEFKVFQADFKEIDTDGSGLIDTTEISTLLRKQLKRQPSKKEVPVRVDTKPLTRLPPGQVSNQALGSEPRWSDQPLRVSNGNLWAGMDGDWRSGRQPQAVVVTYRCCRGREWGTDPPTVRASDGFL